MHRRGVFTVTAASGACRGPGCSEAVTCPPLEAQVCGKVVCESCFPWEQRQLFLTLFPVGAGMHSQTCRGGKSHITRPQRKALTLNSATESERLGARTPPWFLGLWDARLSRRSFGTGPMWRLPGG